MPPEYAGGNFSKQGNYLFRLQLLDCLYWNSHQKSKRNYWVLHVTFIFLHFYGRGKRGGGGEGRDVEVNKDANKERGQYIYSAAFSHIIETETTWCRQTLYGNISKYTYSEHNSRFLYSFVMHGKYKLNRGAKGIEILETTTKSKGRIRYQAEISVFTKHANQTSNQGHLGKLSQISGSEQCTQLLESN